MGQLSYHYVGLVLYRFWKCPLYLHCVPWEQHVSRFQVLIVHRSTAPILSLSMIYKDL